jgi:hypothetical protein
MYYQNPTCADLGGIGQPMNPLTMPQNRFVDASIATQATRLLNVPDGGFATVPRYGLRGVRDFVDVFAISSFLFPE